MPYEVIDNADNCSGFAVVKVGDTTPIDGGCHHTKQHAEDHASALNIATADEERAIDLSPPQFMRSAAKRGLELYAEGHGGDGLVQATISSARKMANGEVSIEKWRKIGPWIARHLVDLDASKNNNPSDPDYPGAGLVAHLLWGSGPSKERAERAMNYAIRLVDRFDKEEDRAGDPSTPAPKKDQIFGSDKNKPGSAKGPAGSSTITLTDAVEKSLQNKASTHNERMSELDKPAWTKVTVGALRSVYRRGAGAFSTSHRPGMTRGQWAMGRVNAFLYLAEKGKPENPKYVADNDLLNKEHPKYSKAGRALDVGEGYEGEYPMDEELDMQEDEMETEEPSDEIEVEVEVSVSIPVEWISKSVDDKRSVAYTNLEARAIGEGNTLVGYAALWDTPSHDMGFTEYVTRGAFTKTLKDGADVRLLFDHEGAPLARTKSGTLRLSEDDRGLRVEADLDPANPLAQSIMSALRRGDLNQMSFAFRTIKDSWNTDRSVRELREVQLFDVSVVTYPAYEETVAELRAMQYNRPATPIRLRKQQIALARIK